MLTVGDLKEMLEEFDDDAEVRLASQPNWPFEYSVLGVVDGNLLTDREEDENGDYLPEDNEYSGKVYLVEGNQLGYFTKRAWNLF
jgi:hypothetical protein